jgi:hypothetical protein
VLGGEFLGVFGEPPDRAFPDVVGGRLHELGLSALGARAPRQIEIGQREIGLEAADGFIEGAARDTHGLRLRPKLLQPFLEPDVGRRCRRRCKEHGGRRHQCRYRPCELMHASFSRPS